jgi:tol-pal system protein YbgF
MRLRDGMAPAFLTPPERDPYDRLAVVCRAAAGGEVPLKRFTTITFATFTLAGCAGGGQARSGTVSAADAVAQPSLVQEMQRESAEQSRRIAELEARLGLLEQEARQWRHAPGKPTQTVKIGGRREDGASSDADHEAEARVSKARLPVVRLHEREAEPSAHEPLILPEPPAGVSAKLAVVPLPHERASTALRADRPAPPAVSAREQYRAALRALRDRRWDEALRTFSAFLRDHPEHDLVEHATYWRGEAHYARRQYRDAMLDFEAVALRSSGGVRTADALLKLALCHRRLGDQISAERYLRQLREQYPSSDAARIASRENPS